jgi:hypothetical protein
LGEYFKKTDLGKILDSNETENIWDGEDAFLDKQLKTSADDYSMRLIRNVSIFDAFLIIDVKADVVKKILSELKLDKTGFVGLVTLGEKEMIDYTPPYYGTKHQNHGKQLNEEDSFSRLGYLASNILYNCFNASVNNTIRVESGLIKNDSIYC